MINTVNESYFGLVEVSVLDYINACTNKLRDLDADNDNNRWNIGKMKFSWWETIKESILDISSTQFKELEKYRKKTEDNNNFINDLANTRYILKVYEKETMLVNLDLFTFIYHNK